MVGIAAAVSTMLFAIAWFSEPASYVVASVALIAVLFRLFALHRGI